MKALALKLLGGIVLMCSFFLLLLWTTADNHLLGYPQPQSPGQPPTNLGKQVYDAKCAVCHGKEGKGDGPATAALDPKPRDFTLGKYKYRSTESGSIPTDDDLLKSIRKGLHGTAMIDWESNIGGDSLRAILDFVKLFSPRFKSEKPKPVQVGLVVPISNATIDAGRKVYDRLQCSKCHGHDGKGTGAEVTTFMDDWGFETHSTNLTEPWTFRGGSSIRDIYLRFRTGMDGTPMPSYVGAASDRDLWSVAQYVASIARKPAWSMNEQELRAHYGQLDQEAKTDPVRRGRYLVSVLGCTDCHTPLNPTGNPLEGMQLAGGQRWEVYPFATFYTANLTSDPETGLGSRTDQQIKDALTKGIKSDGSRMLPFPMPWPSMAGLKEDDLNAIIAHLRSLPPVYNKGPELEKPNVFSYLWGKFQMMILKKPMPAYIRSGNHGAPKERSLSQAVTSGKEKRP